MKIFIVLAQLSLLLLSTSVSAMNIVLTNDDSWNTQNIKALKKALTKAGHDVVLSTPCTQQSGKGGAVHFMVSVPVDTTRKAAQEYCIGDTDVNKPFKDYVPGSPVMAALYGIDHLANQYWQAKPDLLISGPNEGNNLGVVNNNSGTLGAAMIAIAKGVPTIAVSAHESSQDDPEQSANVASIVVRILSLLEASQGKGEPLLPMFTGLNINLPEQLNTDTDYKFTRVGWSSGMEMLYSEDISKNPDAVDLMANIFLKKGQAESLDSARQLVLERFHDYRGISFRKSNLGDTAASSEANALAKGFITISTIDASIQASDQKVSQVEKRLALINQ